MSVGIEFFNKIMTPLGLTLLFLAGAAPLLAWRKTTRERLWNQFMFPSAVAAITIAGFVLWFPETRHLSPIFSDTLQLPVSLINFGLVAFTIGSIVQEYWRGMAVRRRQTGSDPFTSLIGLILSKRRKYGGYIIHLGIAVMFFGFAGKAYERMADRTIEKPAVTASDATKARFTFGEYEFVYDRLIHTSDDHKDAVTAQVSIYHHGDLINVVYPAKWDYHKGEGQATTEVAITVRAGLLQTSPTQWPSVMGRHMLAETFGEDVYVVLTGYDLDSGLANLRIYLNPLILWVWVGFLILAFGTLMCLIPQGVVDRLSRPRTTRLGRAGELAVMVLVAGGVLAGIASQAHAASAPPAEHVQAGMGMGADGTGYAAMNRPTNGTEDKAMKELLCVCGCPRESVFDCKCSTAAQLRRQVMDYLGQVKGNGQPLFDLKTQDGRDAAYEAVLEYFVKTYGGEQVLATPRTKFSWLLPSLAVIGGLGLLVVAGRRWVGRGSATATMAAAAAAAGPAVSDDDAYADKLDDELADSD
jgi:cytochrome c-type biogenesis protein CcmF